jgi:CRISPR/Cas system-associated protein Csm6
MDSCSVVASDGESTVFEGTELATVEWLEANPSEEPRYVYVSATADILPESQFLDLAS